MKIKTQGNILFVESEFLTKEKVLAAKQFAPNALFIKDERGNDKYGVGEGTVSTINANSITFGTVTADGFLLGTFNVSGMTSANAKELVASNFGVALANFAEYEATVADQIEQALAPIEAAMANLESL